MELRGLRRAIGEIEVRTDDGWRVRAEALAILFNEDERLRSETRGAVEAAIRAQVRE